MKIPVSGETALLVLPPPDIRNEINMWRRVFKAYQSTIAPHITIIYPFITSNIWDESRRDVVGLLQGIHSFDIKLRELGTFVGDESVLWLKPENGHNLMKIRTMMHERFAKHTSSPSLAYVPHLTLGFFQTVEEMLQARKTVQKQIKVLQFTVNKLLYAIFESEGWRIHDNIPLK
ncbi:2'-5' RNA ligase family protein [candidate division WOR-3 bacterium]|nr:2'-5' RNA ligase family protein [candidate division WOR-3 bacterium]